MDRAAKFSANSGPSLFPPMTSAVGMDRRELGKTASERLFVNLWVELLSTKSFLTPRYTLKWMYFSHLGLLGDVVRFVSRIFLSIIQFFDCKDLGKV